MAVPLVVLGAMDDWERILQSRANKLANPAESEHDKFRTSILETIHTHCCVSFTAWDPEDVYVFALLAYPMDELKRLTSEGQTSEFFELLHKKWSPKFEDWMHLLWRYSGSAHEYFADLVFLLPKNQRAPMPEMGRVFFRELLKDDIIPVRALPSVMGAIVDWPRTSSMALIHEKIIYRLARDLSPVETGLMCRSLVLYRTRTNCLRSCGYRRDDSFCVCNETNTEKGEVLYGDTFKEYALALYKCVLAQHDPENVNTAARWTARDRDEFLQSACEVVFSDQIYIELYQNVNGWSRVPTLRLEHPRTLSKMEIICNTSRVNDADYHNGFAQHAGCVEPGCKQSVKQGCTNVCCATHCPQIGWDDCRVHRVYNKGHLPTYQPRPFIRNSHEIMLRRFDMSRENRRMKVS